MCKGTVEGWDLRYYGRFFDADGEEIGGVMAAGYESGFKWHARRVIDNILASREYRRRNEEWKKSNDSESVGCVFHILSEKFRQRIVDGKYDVSLNGKVPGGDYEVPLPYVTKAWDYLLKDTLCNNEWRVEDDPDDYPRAERTREQAIAQNERMKAIWKEFFDIDVDALDVDFSQFNMHMTPNVDIDTEYIHFMDVPDGIEEWILDGIMFPSGASAFDSVSSLMEFAAYTGVQRETWEE